MDTFLYLAGVATGLFLLVFIPYTLFVVSVGAVLLVGRWFGRVFGFIDKD